MASALQTVTYKQHRKLADFGWHWDSYVARRINGGAWQPSTFKDADLIDVALDMIESELKDMGWTTRRTRASVSMGVEIHEVHAFKATDVTPKPPRL